MIDEASFVEEIRRSPLDLTPRLIYADFLEDQGDPRGEFIRVQCELSELPAGTPGRSDLFNRERALLEEFGDGWLQPLRNLGAEALSIHCFERGLLERIQFDGADWKKSAKQVCELAPAITSLRLRNPGDYFEDLDTSEFPQQITEINIAANQLTAEVIAEWAPNVVMLPHLRSFDFSRNQLGATALMLLPFASADQVSLGFNGITGDQFTTGWANLADAFLENHPARTLVSLDLSGNPIGATGLPALVSQSWPKLEFLNLASCQIQSIEPFASEDIFPELKRLILRDNGFGDWDDLTADEAARLRNLTTLDLRNTPAAAHSHGI